MKKLILSAMLLAGASALTSAQKAPDKAGTETRNPQAAAPAQRRIPAPDMAAESARQKARMDEEREARLESDRAFKKTLESKTPAERKAAMYARQEEMKKEAAARRVSQHQAALAGLKEALSKNTSLSEVQKTEKINKFEQDYRENSARMEQRRKENEAFMETLKDMTPEQRQSAVKARMEKERANSRPGQTDAPKADY